MTIHWIVKILTGFWQTNNDQLHGLWNVSSPPEQRVLLKVLQSHLLYFQSLFVLPFHFSFDNIKRKRQKEIHLDWFTRFSSYLVQKDTKLNALQECRFIIRTLNNKAEALGVATDDSGDDLWLYNRRLQTCHVSCKLLLHLELKWNQLRVCFCFSSAYHGDSKSFGLYPNRPESNTSQYILISQMFPN